MNITAIDLVIAAFATYRISLMFTKESGPGAVFEKLRDAFPKYSGWYDWITCIFCFSMAASFFVCVVLGMAGTTGMLYDWFLLWFGLSAFTIAMNQAFTKEKL